MKNPFEGKSPNERNKIIVAIVLGVFALGSLFIAFGGTRMFSSTTKVTVTASPTPKASASVPINPNDLKMPSQTAQMLNDSTTPISCCRVLPGPEAGRNIFAFYEPPEPTPYSPTPLPTPVPPTPTPTPHIYIAAVNPTSVYAGSKGFRMDVAGDRMLPDAKVYLSQTELRTTFVNEQRVTAEVPAGLISSEGPRQLIIQTPDGKKYSNMFTVTVQAPPRPQFQYIGMIARKRSNNDTAYFMEPGRQTPLSARLNDIVGGRFRLISISAEETIFEDVNLGFKHPIQLFRPAPGTAASSGPPRPNFPGGDSFQQFTPPTNYQVPPGQSIPGIPDNIPRYVPPNPNTNRPQQPQKDKDEDDGDGKP